MTKKNRFNKNDLLKPENMIFLYSRGAFPMADDSGDINWYMPEIRTIIPLDNFNIPRSLKKFMEKSGFEFRYDFDQMEVIKNCSDRTETWISDELIEAYQNLCEAGHIHSVETYLDNELVGGLYGVAYRGAFFGESMFSKVSQASKAALVKLIERLNQKGFLVLDVQYTNPHLEMFGSVEIPFDTFSKLLIRAYSKDVKFN